MKIKSKLIQNPVETSRDTLGSNKTFGFVFCLVFLAIGFWPVLDGQVPRSWALSVACALFFLSIFLPNFLKPFNQLWFKFGKFLHLIVTPISMLFLFTTTIIPIGVVLRLVGKDPLQKRFDHDVTTYWITRDPPGPSGDTMKNQF